MFKIFSTYICWINIQNATLEASGAVRPIYGSLGVKGLNGLVRLAERRNLVSAREPSRFNWPLHIAFPLNKRAKTLFCTQLAALHDNQYEPLQLNNALKHAINAATALFITA